MKAIVLLVLVLFSVSVVSQTTSNCSLPLIPKPIESDDSSIEAKIEKMETFDFEMNHFMESIVRYRECLSDYQNGIDPEQENAQEIFDEVFRLSDEADDQENIAINRYNGYIGNQN